MLQQSGRIVQAEALYRRILSRDPSNLSALHLLGLLARDCGHIQAAAVLLRRAVEAAPGEADYRSNLGAALCELGRLGEAEAELRHALRLQPGHADAQLNLGVVLERMGREDKAAAALRRAVELRPGDAALLNHLGTVLRHLGRVEEAAESHRRALALDPNDPAALSGLAWVHGQRGQVAESIACYRRIVAAHPDNASAHSDLLYTLHYDDGQTPQTLFAEHLEWARRHAAPLAAEAARPHDNDANPERRLRVGYVSADFRRHTDALFIEPVLEHHDHERFEVFCYSDVARPDETTARIRKLADVWRVIAGAPDARVAELIRRDRIDVLVELAGHMGGNRMPLFARKPAPVQVAYPGYPNTTGLGTIDYLITDADRDPPGAEALYTEALVRLPVSGQCYRPPDDAPPVGPLPMETAGHVTFGCLNKLEKVTPRMLGLWGRVLEALPAARLLVLAADEAAARRLFADHGIAGERLEVTGRLPRGQYMSLYNRIDVALDTFPYNGHTTTLDALWMGVPTVTLAGETHLSREGLAALRLVGLEAFVARTPDDYVETAVRIASDRAALAELRRCLRGRMSASPLCDSPALTRRLEGAYRRAWEQWCASKSRATA